jgi:hypothetical protein
MYASAMYWIRVITVPEPLKCVLWSAAMVHSDGDELVKNTVKTIRKTRMAFLIFNYNSPQYVSYNASKGKTYDRLFIIYNINKWYLIQ